MAAKIPSTLENIIIVAVVVSSPTGTVYFLRTVPGVRAAAFFIVPSSHPALLLRLWQQILSFRTGFGILRIGLKPETVGKAEVNIGKHKAFPEVSHPKPDTA